MYKSTGFLYLFTAISLFLFSAQLINAQSPDTLFYDSFENMDNWTPVGPLGQINWSVENSNYAGGLASPEVRFTWEYLFVGESYLLATPVFTGMQGHNMELKFNYYEDYWSNIVYVGVAITGDGGTTYNSIWELQAGSNSGPEQITVDFTGIDNMQVALYYLGDANDIDFWYVDDFTLMDLDAVPVELTSFKAQSVDGNVNLEWQTATETNNKGFEVQRYEVSPLQGGELKGWVNIGFVEGNGTTTKSHSYSFINNNVETGSYSYRLKQIDFDGSFEYSNIVDVEVTNIPLEFSLSQNYPNPFNPTTNINFSLPVDSRVTLEVYNILGQKVKTLISNELTAGNNNITFDASGFNSGVYIYRIEAEGNNGEKFSANKKMILTK